MIGLRRNLLETKSICLPPMIGFGSLVAFHPAGPYILGPLGPWLLPFFQVTGITASAENPTLSNPPKSYIPIMDGSKHTLYANLREPQK
jgi:hypothetical protein